MCEEVCEMEAVCKSELKDPDCGIPHWIRLEDLVEGSFSKMKSLRLKEDKDVEFAFPTSPNDICNSMYWTLGEVVNLREKLKDTKSKIDVVPLERWLQHTRKMNVAGLVPLYIKEKFRPEFPNDDFGKLFQILTEYGVIPDVIADDADEIIAQGRTDDKVPFDSVHLCEAPGAFISALNHFLKVSYMKLIDWNWMATSLNPCIEENASSTLISDNRLIAVTQSNWTFLADNTGNIMNKNGSNSLLEAKKEKLDKPRQDKRCKAVGSRVLLVTADGSINRHDNPLEHEILEAHLQFAEIVTALRVLSEGGSFVLRIHSLLDTSTVCHLYMLCSVFNQVDLYKPSTSAEDDSEVYAICLDFKGAGAIDQQVKRKLLQCLDNYGKQLEEGTQLLSFSKISEDFMERFREAARFFCNHQMEIIRRNIHSFATTDPTMYQGMACAKQKTAEQWAGWGEIKSLDSCDKLVKELL